MLKKIIAGVALAWSASAFAADLNPAFKSLLQNNGTMEKNTLKITGIYIEDESETSIAASGELIATGVLVRDSHGKVVFYPDRNLTNVVFNTADVQSCSNETACKRLKPNSNADIEVRSKDDSIKKAFGARIYGDQAIRAKVVFNGYTYYSGAYFDEEYLSVKSIFPLTPEKKAYEIYTSPTGQYPITAIEFEYNSKDSYVNIRQTPKGTIVGQILRADMQKPKAQRGIITCANIGYENGDGAFCRDTNGWYEMFYFPAGTRNGKDAIYGYVHKSQVKGW